MEQIGNKLEISSENWIIWQGNERSMHILDNGFSNPLALIRCLWKIVIGLLDFCWEFLGLIGKSSKSIEFVVLLFDFVIQGNLLLVMVAFGNDM